VTLETLASSPVGVRVIDSLVRHDFATRPIGELSEALLYRIVAEAAGDVSSEHWTSDPGRRFPWEDAIAQPDADRLGRATVAGVAASWWSGDVAARPQVWLSAVGVSPVAGLLAPEVEGKPRTAIWTSSAVKGMPSAWWPLVESGATCPWPALSIWRIDPSAGARVFEIRAPDDWRHLCETFPGPVVAGWVTPDWPRVAESFDGIHLTVDGLISTQGVVLETAAGLARLAHWDAESTAWLRWPAASVERLGTIENPSHAPVRRGRASPRALRRS
jgi:hypothetical protein